MAVAPNCLTSVSMSYLLHGRDLIAPPTLEGRWHVVPEGSNTSHVACHIDRMGDISKCFRDPSLRQDDIVTSPKPFTVNDVYAFTWSVYFSTLQIVLYALTMPPNRNPSGYNLRLYCA